MNIIGMLYHKNGIQSFIIPGIDNLHGNTLLLIETLKYYMY